MKARVLFSVFLILMLALAVLPATSASADGPEWVSGKDDTATTKAALKYRHLFNPTKSGYEGFLGPCIGGYECNIGQATWDTNPAKYAATNRVVFQYDGAGMFTASIDPEGPNGPYVMQTTASFPAPGTLNYLQLDLRGQIANSVDETVSFKNAQLNGNALSDANGINTWSHFMINGVDLTGGFTLEGDMVLTWPQSGTGCDDCTLLQIKVGYVEPPDTTGPQTSTVTVTPNSVLPDEAVTLTALVDDRTTGGSLVTAAEYSLDGGATWAAMSAADGVFDGVSENVTASFSAPSSPATYSVCVRGTDGKGNVGESACANLVVNPLMTVKVQDSLGNPISGATIIYAKGSVHAGWQTFGTTGADGTVSRSDLTAGTTYYFYAQHNVSTSLQQSLVFDGNDTLTFQTVLVKAKVETCPGVALEGATVIYGSVNGGFHTFGTTGSDGLVSKELFPGYERTFYAHYNNTKAALQTVTVVGQADPLVTFKTTAVTLYFSGTIAHGSANGGWYPFTKPTMEMFPGTRTFLMGGVQVPIEVSGCSMSKAPIILKLKNHDGQPLAGGIARGGFGNAYGTWHVPGVTDANGVLVELRDAVSQPTTMSYEMRFNNTTEAKTQDVSTNAVFEFDTNLLTLRMETCAGLPLDGGNPRFGIGNTFTTWWFPNNPGLATGATAPGEAAGEVFPGTYSFEMQYKATADAKVGVVVPDADTVLTWKTTNVTMGYSGEISYGGAEGVSTWFTKPSMELLPGAYYFKIGGQKQLIHINGCSIAYNSIIETKVWDDRDGNGRQDGGEPGLPDVTVELLDAAGNPFVPAVTTVSDASGNAKIYVAAGAYSLKVHLPQYHAITKLDAAGVADWQDNDFDPLTGKTTSFSVAANSTVNVWDAGLWAPGTVRAFVWDDRDGNGRQDGGEPGLNGVTVKLYDALDPDNLVELAESVTALVGTTNGLAEFTGVPADRPVLLKFILPDDRHNYTIKDAAGVADWQDSDADRTTGETASFQAVKGSQLHEIYDAGLWVPGTINAYAWDDRDGNGRQDGGEPALAGVTVKLLDADDKDALLDTQVTNAAGIATFTNVPAQRQLRLQFIAPADHKLTTFNAAGVANWQNSDADPANAGKTPTFFASKGSQLFTEWDGGLWVPGSVKAFVWDDRDGNGRQDGGEPAVAGATVKLLDVNNGSAVLGTQVTDATGFAILTGVPADRPVKLQFLLPDATLYNYTIKDAAGVADWQDSDADRTTGETAPFQAVKGSQLHEIYDAGVWAPGSIQARAWDDRDGNGRQDGGEPSLAGVTVKLLDASNADAELASATTDAAGIATFTNVPAQRQVRLQFIPPVDHKLTVANAAGVADWQDSDADPAVAGKTLAFAASKGSQLFSDWDGGLWVPGTAQVRIWHDTNGNGRQDGGEPNVAGVLVKLLEANGSPVKYPAGHAQAGQPVQARSACVSGIATLYIPADRQVKLQVVKFTGGVFTVKDAGGVADWQDSDVDTATGETILFNVTKGSQVLNDWDAGLTTVGDFTSEAGNIQSYVWDDRNGNGQQDSGEPALPGVKVELRQPDGAVCACVTTDAAGLANIKFPTGSYLLHYILPSDHAFTQKDKVDDRWDSDPDRATGDTAVFNLPVAQTLTNWDAGLWAPGTIKTRVWDDRDGNGQQDSGEAAFNLPGVTVRLFDADGELSNAVTAADGIATFTGVPADRLVYLVYDLPADHAFTQKDKVDDRWDSDADRVTGKTTTYQATKGSQLYEDFDAGLWAPGTIKSRVWDDRDGNGQQDSGEAAFNLKDVKVQLFDLNGFLAETLTDADGIATFTGVPADRQVYLKYTLPADHAFTQKDKVDDRWDSDPDRTTGMTTTYQATKGSQLYENLDAGLWAPGTIKTRVWDDRDGNGQQDSGEAAFNLPGVTVHLFDADGELSNAVTDADGIATFTGVPADRPVYLVYDLPADHAFTQKDKVDDRWDSDADRVTGKTTTYQATKGSQLYENFDAGLWAPGTIKTRVWDDRDGNGQQDNSESAFNLKDVKVQLFDLNGFLAETLTDADGIATFTSVPADRQVYLKYTLPADHAFTQKDKVDDRWDSDPDRTTGMTTTYQATKGSQLYENFDAGLWAPGTVQARVWWDRNGNGQQDSGESTENVAGVTVKLLDNAIGTVLKTALTDANGIATIAGVPADRLVRLEFVKPAHSTFTQKDKVDDRWDSDADLTTGQTAAFSASKGSQLFETWDAGLKFETAYMNLVSRCMAPFSAAALNQLTNMGVARLADCHIVTAGVTKPDIGEAVQDIYVGKTDKLKKILIGFKADGAAASWQIFNSGKVRSGNFNTLPPGTQMWEAPVKIEFVGWSTDGRYIIANIERYGTTHAGGVAGRFGVAFKLTGCAAGSACYLQITQALPLGNVYSIYSPTRPLYMTSGLSSVTGISIQPDGSYLMTGFLAKGNLYQGINLPPLNENNGPGTWTLPAAP